MDFSFDIFQIYRQYCDIMSWAYASEGQGNRSDDESQKVGRSREALARLLESVESKFCTRFPVFDEVPKLMSRVQLTTDFNEFLCFYDFVFFISRENGQKSITVSKAIIAWRLVLAGRFRLVNQWCDFVEENQRHNISEDTWRQVLAFSRCVHENLEGYDSEGAWPVLIDEFVEHMYRVRGSSAFPHISCNCDDSESEQCEDTVAGLKNVPGSKRKSYDNIQIDQEFLEKYANYSISCNVANTKRRTLFFVETSINQDQNQRIASKDESPKSVKHTTTLGCNKTSICAVEGCLSKVLPGFSVKNLAHSFTRIEESGKCLTILDASS